MLDVMVDNVGKALGAPQIARYQAPDAFTGATMVDQASPQITAEEVVEQEQSVEQPQVVEQEVEQVETTTLTDEDYESFIEAAESDHGSTPIPTHDASEAHLPEDQRSKDVGYGHKIKPSEETSGMIHGIQFKNADGTYIELTDEDKLTIFKKDMEAELDLARKKWDTKLEKINTSWDQLEEGYQAALTSLAYNVGGTKAGSDWTAVLKAAKDKDVKEFAKQLRRQDNSQYTAGMDNRVAKELYYFKLIKNLSEVKSELPLANATQAGVP